MKNVAFGEILHGIEVLNLIEKCGLRKEYRNFLKNFSRIKCGEGFQEGGDRKLWKG